MLRSLVLVLGQTFGILLALATLAFYPPARGRMILIPLTGAGATRLVPLALADGARVIGTGPLPGSLVVSGERGRLTANLAAGILTLAAPPAGCGTTTEAQA